MKINILSLIFLLCSTPVFGQLEFSEFKLVHCTEKLEYNKKFSFARSNFDLDSTKEVSISKGSTNAQKIFAGMGLGFLVGTSAGTITMVLERNIKKNFESGYGTGGFLAMFILGYIGGSAWGVYMLGEDDYTSGSFGYTLLGSAIAAIPFVFPSPIGGTVAFNMTSEPKVYMPELLSSEFTKVDLIKIYF
jgi:hypothetical protein